MKNNNWEVVGRVLVHFSEAEKDPVGLTVIPEGRLAGGILRQLHRVGMVAAMDYAEVLNAFLSAPKKATLKTVIEHPLHDPNSTIRLMAFAGFSERKAYEVLAYVASKMAGMAIIYGQGPKGRNEVADSLLLEALIGLLVPPRRLPPRRRAKVHVSTWNLLWAITDRWPSGDASFIALRCKLPSVGQINKFANDFVRIWPDSEVSPEVRRRNTQENLTMFCLGVAALRGDARRELLSSYANQLTYLR